MLPIPPGDVRLWHLTHVRNLRSITTSGAVFPFSKTSAEAMTAVDVARADIRQQRSLTRVAAFSAGCITDFVPLYLGARPPMLLTIAQNAGPRLRHGQDRRPGYAGGQDSLVYLVTTLAAITGGGLEWCFYDGHATDPFSRCLTGPDAVPAVDWQVLAAPDVANSLADGDRKRRRSAEALVGPCLPVSLIHEVVARAGETASQAAAAMAGSPVPVPVAVRPDLYFSASEVQRADGERCAACGALGRLKSPRRTGLETATAVQAHRFFEPATPVFCADIVRVLRVIEYAFGLLWLAQPPAAAEWSASVGCSGSVPAGDLWAQEAGAACAVSLDSETRAAADVAELLLAPFAGSPYGLRLVSDLLAHLSSSQAPAEAAGIWAAQARAGSTGAHRHIVADHVTRVRQDCLRGRGARDGRGR